MAAFHIVMTSHLIFKAYGALVLEPSSYLFIYLFIYLFMAYVTTLPVVQSIAEWFVMNWIYWMDTDVALFRLFPGMSGDWIYVVVNTM